jgi:transcriptional regulator with XRE-family HTH domain
MIDSTKRPKLVGEFIRKRREAMRMSQRALGAIFNPPVTTQFISNVERGVTPLPPMHVPVLAKALTASEAEIMTLLEREYAHKLSERLGKTDIGGGALKESVPALVVTEGDLPFMKTLYEAYRNSDQKTRQAFATICESVLNLPKGREIT